MSDYRDRILKVTKDFVNKEQEIIDSYTQFDRGRRGWFFTKNASLSGACAKPVISDNRNNFINWNALRVSQRHFFSDNGLGQSDYSYEKLNFIKRILEKWPDNYYVVYYGGDNNYSCNLFVGEVLYAVIRTECMKAGKYYSAREIWNATPPFTDVEKSDISAGDIVAFNGGHVEIVSKVDQEDNSFCAIVAEEVVVLIAMLVFIAMDKKSVDGRLRG